MNVSVLTFIPYLFFFLLFSFICSAVFLCVTILIKKFHRNQSSVILEILPPHDVAKSIVSTEQLFTTLHALGQSVSVLDRLLGQKKIFSLELVSDKKKGIRFLMHIRAFDAEIIKNNIIAYLPDAQVSLSGEYIFTIDKEQYTVTELDLRHHFAYPLEKQVALKENDPIAYITRHMAQIPEDEILVLQIIAAPITAVFHRRYLQIIQNLQQHIYFGKDITPILGSTGIPYIFILGGIVLGIYSYLYLMTGQMKLFILPGISLSLLFFWYLRLTMKTPDKPFTQTQQDVHKQILEKIQSPLFETAIRIYAKKSPDTSRRNGLISSIIASTKSPLQTLIIKRKQPFTLVNNNVFYLLKNRVLSKKNVVLSAGELATLYHVPYTPVTKTEDIPYLNSPVIPLPISVKQDRSLSITFAQNMHNSFALPIGLTNEERLRHMYILGATGTGKTTLLKTMIHEDLNNGNGFCLIDPHGDLSEHLLASIPRERINDVIYVNPADTEYPIGINLLDIPKNLSEKEKALEKDCIASSMVSIFSKLYPPRFTGPRMEYILRNAVLTALETQDPTMITIHRLLVDKPFREQVIATVDNQMLKNFWEKEFGYLGSYQKAEATFPITNKLGRFLVSPVTRYMLSQKHPLLDITAVMDAKKILICNLSKGVIGEDTSALLGGLLIAKIQLAALRRSRTSETDRTDFYLYVDEFQNFATTSFAQIMSEARKYKLSIILAHQTISQIEDRDLINIILANTGTLVSFRTGSILDEAFILPNFYPQVGKGDIQNLPVFSFYMKLQALKPHEAFSGETVFKIYTQDQSVKNRVIAHSRSTYGVHHAIISADMQTALAYTQSSKKIKKTRSRPSMELPTIC